MKNNFMTHHKIFSETLPNTNPNKSFIYSTSMQGLSLAVK